MRKANLIAGISLVVLFILVLIGTVSRYGPPWTARARHLDMLTHNELCDYVNSALRTRQKKGTFPAAPKKHNFEDPDIGVIEVKAISADEFEISAKFNYGSDVMVRYFGPSSLALPFIPGWNTFRFRHGDKELVFIRPYYYHY